MSGRRAGRQGASFEDFRIGNGGTNFSYRSVAEKFPHDRERHGAGDRCARRQSARRDRETWQSKQIPSGAIARDLQPYIVQVPPRARARLIECGHVKFVEETLRGDQFAVLRTPSLYDPEVGLVWEDAEYLATEGLVI